MKRTSNHSHKAIGKCRRCGKYIWLPESLAAQMGKVCREKGGMDEAEVEKLQAEFKKEASRILNEQKYGHRKKVKSSQWLWKKNQRLLSESIWRKGK